MVQYGLNDRHGFFVVHESKGWRTACHSYEPTVNGAGALKEWGIHVDSEEAFVLLCGKGVLAVMDDGGQVRITRMEPLQMYVVGAGEKHAIALDQGSRVLIMENEDMSRFQTLEMEDGVRESICRALEGREM